MLVQPSRTLVLRKLCQVFNDASSAQKALNFLDDYGVESYELERERVQLAILKLSEGELGQLRHYVKAAKTDYRDVLAWAEYPEQMRADVAEPNMSPEMLRAIRERDYQQYTQWLSK